MTTQCTTPTALDALAATVTFRDELRREMNGAVALGDIAWAERLDDRIRRLNHDIRVMAREAWLESGAAVAS